MYLPTPVRIQMHNIFICIYKHVSEFIQNCRDVRLKRNKKEEEEEEEEEEVQCVFIGSIGCMSNHVHSVAVQLDKVRM
jgi:hypothetical protein